MKPEDKQVFDALSDIQAKILTVYGEARNQSTLGQQLVAQVIDNRATKHKLTPKQVCYQPDQFRTYP
jgi:spore germination cell wall hydrolase CwlJ-like protein